MNQSEFETFSDLLHGIGEVFDRKLSPAAIAIYWNVLRGYDLAQVRAALSAHVTDSERGKWMPKPADILAQIQGMDGRPDADEAWTIALTAMDDRMTVVSNEEIAQAYGIAAPIFKSGDNAGARMAFRSAYDRIVAENRRASVPVSWFPSLGFDAGGREAPIRRAVERGLLKESALKLLLPVPQTAQVLALAERAKAALK